MTQLPGTTVSTGSGVILIDNGGQAFTQSGMLASSGNSAAAVTIRNTAALSVGTIAAPNGGVVLGTEAAPVGPTIETGAIDPGSLLIVSLGSVALTGPNTVDTLAAIIIGPGASLTFNDTAHNLTVGAVSEVPGITTNNGGVTLTTTTSGNLTLAQDIIAGSGAIALAATGNFVNNVGPAVLQGSGRWLVYSLTPAGDVFAGLNSGNTAIWNATFATLPPASVTQPGNRYLFALQPTLTITTTNLSKTYGQDATAAVANAFAVSGLQPGVAGAFLGDTPGTAFAGTPSVASAGAPATADVAHSPYAITASAGSLLPLDGYAVQFVNAGMLTVNPAMLSVIADNRSKVYGALDPALTFTASGFQFSDTAAGVLTGALARAPGENVGNYAIGQGTLAANANYTIAFTPATLTHRRRRRSPSSPPTRARFTAPPTRR